MTLPELLACADALGIRLDLRLVVDAPEQTLTPAVREGLAMYKIPLMVKMARDRQWEVLRVQRWGDPADESAGIESVGGCPSPETLAALADSDDVDD